MAWIEVFKEVPRRRHVRTKPELFNIQRSRGGGSSLEAVKVGGGRAMREQLLESRGPSTLSTLLAGPVG